ncbi:MULTISPECIES: GLPGLI family protein [unclassified Empedobacter]|uniref:GLPGLI family protein n=1 Tax=unclassified Empedobacter TaxID=2643773 RepID=UPI0025C0B96E|nr:MULTISPECIES: GLPGLI family protein [unclassified Empedobacter]
MRYLIAMIALIATVFSCKKPSNYLVKYNFNFIPDSLNKSDIKVDEMILHTNKLGYTFLSNDLFTADTTDGNITDLIKNNKISINDLLQMKTSPNNDLRLYFRNDSNLYYIKSSVNRLNYSFEDNVPEISWKLLNEEKKINNYKVKKATTNLFGRTWEVWYTEDIPVSYGPYKFHGLPGLILDIKDSEGYFHFEPISIKENEDDVEYPIYKDFNKINSQKSEFVKYIKDYKDNPEVITAKTGENTKIDQEKNLKKKEELKKLNNSIERDLQFNIK